MFKSILASFFICLSIFSFSQTYEIQYESSYNGKVQPNQNPVIVWVNEHENFILNTKTKEQKSDYPFEISKIEKPSNTIVSYAFLKPNEAISTSDKESIAKQEFELTTKTKKILGYNCKKAITKINSNTIEVWYTNDLKLKGRPSSLGQNLGLVLQIERNRNSATTAISVKKIKTNGN